MPWAFCWRIDGVKSRVRVNDFWCWLPSIKDELRKVVLFWDVFFGETAFEVFIWEFAKNRANANVSPDLSVKGLLLSPSLLSVLFSLWWDLKNVSRKVRVFFGWVSYTGSCHKRQKALAPTPEAPIRYCQTRKVAIAEVYNHFKTLT